MPLLDSTDADLDAFDDVCMRLGGFDARIDAEWADGYLTALAAGPRALSIDEWLPRMAGDAFERAFADPPSAQAAQAALLARTRVLASHLDPEALLDFPDQLRLQPRLSMWDEADGQSHPDAPRAGERWALGFFEALRDFADDWQSPADQTPEDAELLEDLLAEVQVLLLDPDGEEMRNFLEQRRNEKLATREDLVDGACFAIQELRVWWLDHAPKPPTRRVAPQPGRNDPCPCGSGVKFKKCHGRGA